MTENPTPGERAGADQLEAATRDFVSDLAAKQMAAMLIYKDRPDINIVYPHLDSPDFDRKALIVIAGTAIKMIADWGVDLIQASTKDQIDSISEFIKELQCTKGQENNPPKP